MIRTRSPHPLGPAVVPVSSAEETAFPGGSSARARARMLEGWPGTVFLADWTEASFLHFEVDGDRLARAVPFPLDRYEGRAFITLVAFTMRHLRPRYGGRATGWILAPIATHRFLNLRTYVRGKDGEGIFFLHEWLNNRCAVALGPATFGLPYHYASLDYRAEEGHVSGQVRTPTATCGFDGKLLGDERGASPGSLEEFLLERYVAYTAAGWRPKSFRVWHRPWRIRTFAMEKLEVEGFLASLGEDWAESLKFENAVFSDGVRDVWMGRPRRA